jgi:hypothetical protein
MSHIKALKSCSEKLTLGYGILYNESKPNILALVGKSNKSELVFTFSKAQGLGL